MGKWLIDRHSVFLDVFDTLIIRDCSEPADVFDLVERQAVKRGLMIHGFRDMRIAAERLCEEDIFAPTLDEIYSFLPVERREELKSLEIELEQKICLEGRIPEESFSSCFTVGVLGLLNG